MYQYIKYMYEYIKEFDYFYVVINGIARIKIKCITVDSNFTSFLILVYENR